MSAVPLQLNPYIEVQTPFGPGMAHFLIYEGPESDLKWVVFMDDGGYSVTVPNPKIRGVRNWSYFRPHVDLPPAEIPPWEMPHILETQKKRKKPPKE